MHRYIAGQSSGADAKKACWFPRESEWDAPHVRDRMTRLIGIEEWRVTEYVQEGQGRRSEAGSSRPCGRGF